MAGAAIFLYVETFFNVCASVLFGEHMCWFSCPIPTPLSQQQSLFVWMGTITQQQTGCTFHSHQIVCGTNYLLPRATAVDTKSQPGSDVRNCCLLSIACHGQPYPNPPAPNVCDVLYYPSSFHYVTLCGLLIACFLIFSGSILVLFDLRRPREACAYLPKGSLAMLYFHGACGLVINTRYIPWYVQMVECHL